jgi:hypothetical protein
VQLEVGVLSHVYFALLGGGLSVLTGGLVLLRLRRERPLLGLNMLSLLDSGSRLVVALNNVFGNYQLSVFAVNSAFAGASLFGKRFLVAS